MSETAKASPFAPPAPVRPTLVGKFAARYSIEPEKLLSILKATAFKQQEGEVSNEQMAALLVVADQHGLNPFTREIFAFADKHKGIVPVVGVDGWSRIINDHPQSDGIEFRVSEEMETLEEAQPCPSWMECVIYRKDRSHPIVVREYLDEVYRPPFKRGDSVYRGPWQTHTKRFLRHKTLIQAARLAYGFAGIYDEDEAQRIIEGDVVRVDPLPVGGGAQQERRAESSKDKLRDAGKRARGRKGKEEAGPGAVQGAAGTPPRPTQDTLLADVKAKAAKAAELAAKDLPVALLTLDDAKDFARSLEGDASKEAQAAIAAAEKEIEARSAAK